MIILTFFFSAHPSLNIGTFVHFLLQHYINGYFTIMYYLWFTLLLSLIMDLKIN